MRLERFENEKKPKIMIIPMIDIIFFLLVFFMMSMLSMVTQRSIGLNLPQVRRLSLKRQRNFLSALQKTGQFLLRKSLFQKQLLSTGWK